jgi:hypothetical protein
MVRSRHLLLVLLLASTAGCATGTSKSGHSGPRKNLSAADYYPLALGWKWAYDLEKDGEKILAVYAVLERTPDTAVVQAGDERLVYAITADGIAQKEGAAIADYVIKNPVTVGAGWPVAGGTAKVVSVSQQVTLDAGQFSDCAVIEVTRTDPVRIARTTFAPDVGPVALEFQVQDGGRFVTATKATLRSVTKPGEDLFR